MIRFRASKLGIIIRLGKKQLIHNELFVEWMYVIKLKNKLEKYKILKVVIFIYSVINRCWCTDTTVNTGIVKKKSVLTKFKLFV